MKIKNDEFHNYLRMSPIDMSQMLCADPGITACRNDLGETLLHWWAIEFDLKWVKLYFENRSDLNTKNDFDGTPLMDVCGIKSNEVALGLMDLGADIDFINSNQESALSKSADSESLLMVKILVGKIKRPIQDYFNAVSANLILSESNDTSIFLKNCGLIDPWLEQP